ncbi:MAG: hypothetical protein A2096_05915 [Spirochaetes bacterium GWF1_41_5]|nr:MAG: hypothetical protein A2096_05915 [Spirochaetes bacterium GWF1_41_5]HBE04777.1 hypothetical protein [Spirochaetia bacterium]
MQLSKFFILFILIALKLFSADLPVPLLYFSFNGTLAPENKPEQKCEKSGEISFIEGYKGQAVYIKNPKSALRYPDMTLPGEKGTVMFWFKPDWKEKAPVGGVWFYTARNKAWKTYMDIYRADWEGRSFFQVRMYDNTWQRKADKQIDDIKESGKWYHLALVWDSSSSIVVYLNGEPKTRTETSWSVPDDTFSLLHIEITKGEIGVALDEYKIFDQALPANLIQAIFTEPGTR